jgi:hypothetical protein
MALHLFRHTTDVTALGVTNEPSGAKLPVLSRLSASLPPSPGKWIYLQTVAETNGAGLSFIGFSEEKAQAEIEQHGYYVHYPNINLIVKPL